MVMFDETDKEQMAAVAEAVAAEARAVFAPRWHDAALNVVPGHKLPPAQLEQLLQLLDTTIGLLYHDIEGPDWKQEKVDEMQEKGLVYAWYGDDVMAFVSFMLVEEEGVKVLYLYEIHVDPRAQGEGLGGEMVGNLHQLARALDRAAAGTGAGTTGTKISTTGTSTTGTGTRQHLSCKGTSLTVFSKNQKAFEWYKKLGYELAEHSPVDRWLRGRRVKPSYYIMTRKSE